MPASFAAFVRLSRLKFLVGGFIGGLFGTAVAAFERGHVSWTAYAGAQATITAFHLMTHYSNDYFDRRGDALGRPTAFAGGSGVLTSGALAPVVALRAAVVCAAAGVAGTLVLWLALQRPVAALVALAIFAGAWSYSSPPLRLLARGLGEVDTALVVGSLVPLVAYAAQSGGIDGPAVAATIPGAAAMFAMMVGVEFPDRAADAASGKRTLVVRLGIAGAARLGSAAAAAVYLAVALALMSGAPPAYAVAEVLSLPLALLYRKALAGAAGAASGAAEDAAAGGVAFSLGVTFLGLLGFARAFEPR